MIIYFQYLSPQKYKNIVIVHRTKDENILKLIISCLMPVVAIDINILS